MLGWESGNYYKEMAIFDYGIHAKNARTQFVLECPLPRFSSLSLLQGGRFDPRSLGMRGKCCTVNSISRPFH